MDEYSISKEEWIDFFEKRNIISKDDYYLFLELKYNKKNP